MQPAHDGSMFGGIRVSPRSRRRQTSRLDCELDDRERQRRVPGGFIPPGSVPSLGVFNQRKATNIFGLLTPDPTLAHLNTSIACRGFHREASGHPRTNPKLNIGGVRGNGVSNVTGILAGMRVVGTLKRFHVDIASVTFLGPALPAYTTQAMTPTPKGRRKAGISFDDKPIPTKKSRT